ncbi:MAG TPA: TlpA disulfide reductase family protein [Solirubrobacteraceae bacterium]|nr:TlpA disulfide reductase family protein [Solirubrobacteraceae bacterium]
MTPKRLSIAALLTAVLALLAVGLVQLAGSSSPTVASSGLTLAQMQARLRGAPPALAALHAQADQLLPGGLPALRARLASLRGTPVVINKWASDCEPCREEVPVFQRVSVSRGREVAFIGIDSNESSRGEALSFLHSFPVAYPSYFDPSGQAGETITDSSFTPVTVFYDRSGGEFIHQGPFPSVAKLEAAVERYALDA